MECKKCEKTIDDYRYHLGYTECVECSEVEKYSAPSISSQDRWLCTTSN